MGKKQFSEEQIAFALRQAESGTSVAEIIRKLGISEQIFYRWKKRFRKSRVAHQPGNGCGSPIERTNLRRNARLVWPKIAPTR
jgi:transposase-like protein